MDIGELGITSREQKTLERMGFDSVEKIALSHRDDLGLGKAKGDSVIQRARNILANRNVRDISMSDDKVTVTLADSGRATLTSVRSILGVYDLRTAVDDNRLVVFQPHREPCSECGVPGTYLCKECGAGVCDECRYAHKHRYNLAAVHYLEGMFEAVRDKARMLECLPQKSRREDEDRPAEEVVRLAKELGFSGFVSTFFAELEGNEAMKKALSCALFSVPEEPVHVLVMGDPAGGKTLAKDIITRRLGPEIELVGANATRSGLVCNLATGEPGALADSDGKIVLVDEFDKIPDQDVEYCLELLSNGKCSIHSARIHETIESHFIMIAFANPVDTVFMKDPISEIGLPAVLLSRFALIVKAEVLDTVRRKALLKRKLLGETSVSEYGKWLLPWLREARKYHPTFEVSEAEIDSYVEKVDSLIEQHMKTPLRRDMRMADYAKRVPFAMARASFGNVDGRILGEAIKLIEDTAAAW
jgi:hypothetical protein